jgi:hypothetical protein
MIETLAVPLVVKAIEFLFDESKKVLEERRTRREAELNASINSGKQEVEKPVVDVPSKTQAPVEAIHTKESALDARIDEIRLKALEKDIAHLLELSEIYKDNLYQARGKFARFGRDYAPPHLLYEIKEAEDGFVESSKKLNILLSQLYGKEIIVPGLD